MGHYDAQLLGNAIDDLLDLLALDLHVKRTDFKKSLNIKSENYYAVIHGSCSVDFSCYIRVLVQLEAYAQQVASLQQPMRYLQRVMNHVMHTSSFARMKKQEREEEEERCRNYQCARKQMRKERTYAEKSLSRSERLLLRLQEFKKREEDFDVFVMQWAADHRMEFFRFYQDTGLDE